MALDRDSASGQDGAPDGISRKTIPGDATTQQRLDLWLWYARFAKTRTLAQALISRGRVRVNRIRIAKTSHAVRPADVVTLSTGPRVRVIEIKGIAERRGPASDAALLYVELTPAPDRSTSPRPDGQKGAATQAGPETISNSAPAPRTPGAGRPTKRDRRQITRLKARFED